jgi:hypothetical protein
MRKSLIFERLLCSKIQTRIGAGPGHSCCLHLRALLVEEALFQKLLPISSNFILLMSPLIETNYDDERTVFLVVKFDQH